MKKNSSYSIFALFLLLSVIFFPGYSQSTAGSNVSRFTMDEPQLDTKRQIWVYLPSSYHSLDKTYPVLYLQDAQNLFDKHTSFSGEWRVDEILDSLKTEIIVVGIEHGGDKRIEELTPFPHPEYKGGKADTYLDFIVSSLMPEIQQRYRILSGPESTFIGGSSLGGLFAYYSVLKHPEIFGKGVIFSPSFWYSEKIFDFTEKADIHKVKDTKMYLRAGDSESETMIPLMFKIRQKLIDKGYSPCNIFARAIPEGKHNEQFWSSLFPEAVLWLLEE